MTDIRDLTDVKAGDTLFDPGESRYNNRKHGQPRLFHVFKVARQYLYASTEKDVTDIKHWSVEKVDRKSGLTAGSGGGWGGFYLYRSEAVHSEIKYRAELCDKIRKEFGTNSVRVPEITTDELRGIAKTLGVEF